MVITRVDVGTRALGSGVGFPRVMGDVVLLYLIIQRSGGQLKQRRRVLLNPIGVLERLDDELVLNLF